jgi:hypothetical protein
MFQKLKPFLAAGLFVIIAFAQVVQAKQDSTSATLICSEEDGSEADGGTGAPTISTTTVSYDKKGEIQAIELVRRKYNGAAAMKLHFIAGEASFSDQVVATGDDQSNPDGCATAYCIEKIQVISAKNKKGESLIINVNDHAYAGTPGSSVKIRTSGKKISTEKVGTMVSCDGRAMLPWNSGVSADELLE